MFDIDSACLQVLYKVHSLTTKGVEIIGVSELFPLEDIAVPNGYDLVIIRELCRNSYLYSPGGNISSFDFLEITAKGFRHLVNNGLIYEQNEEKTDYNISDKVIPASDRVVHISDNQRSLMNGPLEEVIHELEKTNGDPDDPNLRERGLGQLKAGRELIRVGVFRVWLFEQTVLTVLGELIGKYGPTALGVAAKKALELFIEAIAKAL